MIARLAAALALLAGAAAACPAPSETLLFHSCWGAAAAELILLPDEAPPAPEAARHLLVAGAYTGTGTREEGGAPPVGLFIDSGRVINPNLARMDGILILSATGRPRLAHRDRLRFGGRRHDVRAPAGRRAFARAVTRAGASVMQSHLLVVDGVSDVSAQAGAPSHRRRILFTTQQGWGVWQSRGAETLHAATEQLVAALGPRMALNLDMGGHDYCWIGLADAPPQRCGLRRRDDTQGLSNLLSLTLR